MVGDDTLDAVSCTLQLYSTHEFSSDCDSMPGILTVQSQVNERNPFTSSETHPHV